MAAATSSLLNTENMIMSSHHNVNNQSLGEGSADSLFLAPSSLAVDSKANGSENVNIEQRLNDINRRYFNKTDQVA